MTDRHHNLEIESPRARCGYCGFMSALAGTWSVEDGRLVWRGNADLQPRRGPDLGGCGEGWDCGDFDGVEVDGNELSGDDVAALRQSAEVAHDEWLRDLGIGE